MKILITGANGFVGSHLSEDLLKKGHEVYALVRSPKKFSDLINTSVPGLTVIKGDLEDTSWVNLLPIDLDTCIHTAGIVHTYNTDDFYLVNAGGTENLTKALKTRFTQLHFLLVSSLAAAGPSLGSEKKNESDLDFPVSIYGRSKKRAEEVLYENSPKSWEIAIVRPPMVIGPRDAAVLDIFKMVQGRVILLPGMNSRSKLYSFVCVVDLVDTLTKIVEKKERGLFYSAHPVIVSFDQIISEIKIQLKRRWIFFLPLPLILIKLVAALLHIFYRIRPHALRLTPDKIYELAATNWICDGKKSEDILGQVYSYDLKRTISLTLIDYKSRKWI
ncbi:MAG: NAD(P)-dependent oxidoreductase [Bdellovibrionales bacterium]|nr:NAD(P)-dependent oxidoreductase [Bdellovibrionales bacterium]